MFSFLKELSAEDKRIKCFNYLDWNKSYKSSIKRSKGKLIIIDNADILLDDAMRITLLLMETISISLSEEILLDCF